MGSNSPQARGGEGSFPSDTLRTGAGQGQGQDCQMWKC